MNIQVINTTISSPIRRKSVESLVSSTKETDKLVLEVREYYRNVQKSWFYFAKKLKEIKETETFRAYDSINFKDFCLKEFPSLNYTTIIKTIKVVENFGELIESKLEKQPDYTLPAYESCYQLINVKDKIPLKQHKELTMKVFNGKLSFHRFRDEIKKIIEAQHKFTPVDSSDEELERELMEDINTEDETILEIEKEVSSHNHDDVERMVNMMEVRLQFLKDNIPELTELISSDDDFITDDVIEFANELNDLLERSNDFLKTIATLV